LDFIFIRVTLLASTPSPSRSYKTLRKLLLSQG
jgi:hypothetical protein